MLWCLTTREYRSSQSYMIVHDQFMFFPFFYWKFMFFLFIRLAFASPKSRIIYLLFFFVKSCVESELLTTMLTTIIFKNIVTRIRLGNWFFPSISPGRFWAYQNEQTLHNYRPDIYWNDVRDMSGERDGDRDTFMENILFI